MSNPTTADAVQAELSAIYSDIDTDNREARARFVETVPCRLRASTAGRQPENAWSDQGRVFSVQWRGMEAYPEFQFGEGGAPHAIIAAILAALPPEMTAWQRAFWFVSANPWLDGRIPSAMLNEGDAVVGAARSERETVIG